MAADAGDPRGLAVAAADLARLGRGLGLVVRAAPLLSLASVGLTASMSGAAVLQVWLSKLVLDRLADALRGSAGAADAAILAAGWYALTLVAPAVAQPIAMALTAWLENRAVATVDRRVMQAGVALADLHRIERPTFQDEARLILERAGRDLPRLLGMAETVLRTVLTLTGVLLLLARLHPAFPPLLGALFAVHLASERRTHGRIFRAVVETSRDGREADYCVQLAFEPASAKEVRVLGLGDFLAERLHAHLRRALAEVGRARVGALRLSALATGAYAAALAVGFWYTAARAGAGSLTVGDVGLYLGALIHAEARFRGIGFIFGQLYETVLFLRRLFPLIDGARPAIALPAPGEARMAPARLRRGLELRRVSFRYPEGAGEVLRGVDAVLPAGKVTALVGENGAGKSTLVKLITRMYDPDEGEILLDGVPLAAYDLGSLRGGIAVVYQDFARFALTLGENIAVGGVAVEPDAGRLEAAVARAASQAGAAEVAASLPQGDATELTRRFGGTELSTGQWQKVAVARGFVRDAALVILDEPTAALDAEAEHRLFERFRSLVEGRTGLLISHRCSTVRMADRILVLEGGRIVEAGIHPELLAAGGRYAALFELQAGRYR